MRKIHALLDLGHGLTVEQPFKDCFRFGKSFGGFRDIHQEDIVFDGIVALGDECTDIFRGNTLNILITFAQFEREMIATRIKDKMSATRKKGKWVGGVRPFGYIAFEKRLIVDENEAPTVRRIFNRYLEIQSPKQIAYELNQDGIKTGTGKEWNRAHIYRILNNYTYVGKVFYEGHAYPGEHEAIIDDKT